CRRREGTWSIGAVFTTTGIVWGHSGFHAGHPPAPERALFRRSVRLLRVRDRAISEGGTPRQSCEGIARLRGRICAGRHTLRVSRSEIVAARCAEALELRGARTRAQTLPGTRAAVP